MSTHVAWLQSHTCPFTTTAAPVAPITPLGPKGLLLSMAGAVRCFPGARPGVKEYVTEPACAASSPGGPPWLTSAPMSTTRPATPAEGVPPALDPGDSDITTASSANAPGG